MKPLMMGVLMLFFAFPAFAGKETCKNVKIDVQNLTEDDIKVVDIKYYDSSIGQWRNENGVSNQAARRNGGWVHYTRNLEEVLNDSEMKVKVKYKSSILGKWKNPTWSDPSSAGTCTKGEDYTVFVSSS